MLGAAKGIRSALKHEVTIGTVTEVELDTALEIVKLACYISGFGPPSRAIRFADPSRAIRFADPGLLASQTNFAVQAERNLRGEVFCCEGLSLSLAARASWSGSIGPAPKGHTVGVSSIQPKGRSREAPDRRS